ncbi:MAG: protein kinase [Planctomycetia bacterium]|nr:protein kinase [Planctomycetia bacterium]
MSNPIICPQGHRWDPGQDVPTFPVSCPTCGAVVALLDQTLPYSNREAAEVAAPAPAAAVESPVTASKAHGPARPTQDGEPLDQTLVKAPTVETGQHSPDLSTIPETDGGSAATATATMASYEIIDTIGRGGMGVVYKAKQVKLNRIVALKMILAGAHASAQEKERFRLEAEAVAQLQHSNIVQIYEVGELEGKPYLSLEYIDGGSLANLIQGGKPLAPQRAAQLVEQLAQGIHRAHQRGIIHRDLKPANVLLTSEGVPKIADFGLAKHINDISRTVSGAVVGTPNYMAPEQAQGQNQLLGPHTDVYALGAILYHLLTGRPPFDGESVLTVLKQVETYEAVPPSRVAPNVPRDLETITLKCLEKQPDKRYATAEALAEELRRFLNGEPILARPVGRLERCVKWCRRRPERAALVVVSFISVVATAAALILWREEIMGRQAVATAPTAPQERVYTPAEMRASAITVRRALFGLLAKHQTPAGWFPANIDPRAPVEIEVRSHARTLAALLRSPDVDNDELRRYLPALELPFTPGHGIEVDGVKLGWRSHGDVNYPQADSALWLVTALALALGRPGLIPDEDRPRFEGHLLAAQQVLRHYRPPKFTGGWNMFARQKDMHRHSVFTTALALRTLCEVYKADLDWEGSPKVRDELLRTTSRWLAEQYRGQSEPPGWSPTNDAVGGVDQPLTLFVYSALLHANVEFGCQVADEMRDDIEDALDRIMHIHLIEHDHATVETTYIFLDPQGKERLVDEVTRFSITAWAIEACIHWFQGVVIHREKPEDIARLHRVLGRVLVGGSKELATVGVEDRTFVPAERLFGISCVPAKELAEKRKTKKP